MWAYQLRNENLDAHKKQKTKEEAGHNQTSIMFNQNPDSTFDFQKNQDSIKKFRIMIKKRKSQIWYQETLSENKKQTRWSCQTQTPKEPKIGTLTKFKLIWHNHKYETQTRRKKTILNTKSTLIIKNTTKLISFLFWDHFFFLFFVNWACWLSRFYGEGFG